MTEDIDSDILYIIPLSHNSTDKSGLIMPYIGQIIYKNFAIHLRQLTTIGSMKRLMIGANII